LNLGFILSPELASTLSQLHRSVMISFVVPQRRCWQQGQWIQAFSMTATARRRGAINRPLLAVLGSLALLGLLAANLIDRSSPVSATGPQEPLVIYCAASNRSVLEAIRADYERAYGRPLQIQYGASQSLLAALELSGSGDLYLPADDSYLTLARQRQLVAEEFPLAQMRVVVAVPKGNPKHIERLADLLAGDLRISQASPDSAAIGKLTKSTLEASGDWERLHARTTVYKTTVNEVANDVKVGAVDAGIVFDVVLHDYDTLQAVTIPELAQARAHVAVAVLKTSRQPEQALHLARYMASRDKGLVRYKEFGFQPVEGDTFTDDKQPAP
jgi:molybdate transport system substrate-binding protein